MIEKFLTRFVNDDTKMVLAAMEKVGADPDIQREYYARNAYKNMYDAAVQAPFWVDRTVLTRAFIRLDKACMHAAKRQEAQELAGKILMGEKFEPDNKLVTGNATTASAQAQALWKQVSQGSALGAAGQLGGSIYGSSDPVAQFWQQCIADEDQEARYPHLGADR